MEWESSAGGEWGEEKQMVCVLMCVNPVDEKL